MYVMENLQYIRTDVVQNEFLRIEVTYPSYLLDDTIKMYNFCKTFVFQCGSLTISHWTNDQFRSEHITSKSDHWCHQNLMYWMKKYRKYCLRVSGRNENFNCFKYDLENEVSHTSGFALL